MPEAPKLKAQFNRMPVIREMIRRGMRLPKDMLDEEIAVLTDDELQRAFFLCNY